MTTDSHVNLSLLGRKDGTIDMNVYLKVSLTLRLALLIVLLGEVEW